MDDIKRFLVDVTIAVYAATATDATSDVEVLWEKALDAGLTHGDMDLIEVLEPTEDVEWGEQGGEEDE
jgi:hypothetical protein